MQQKELLDFKKLLAERHELEKQLASLTHNARQKIKDGGTTGDPLTDRLIDIVGVNEDTQRVLTFNEKVKNGKEMLIRVDYLALSPGRHTIVATRYNQVKMTGYLFGLLTGEPIQITSEARPQLVLPFTCWTQFRMPQETDGSYEGSRTVHADVFYKLLSITRFLEAIIKNKNPDFVIGNVGGAELYIGVMICIDEEIANQGLGLYANRFRTMLQKPVEAPAHPAGAVGAAS